MNGDICNYAAIDRLSKRVEAVIRLAALVSPYVSVQRPELANEVNVGGH